MSGHFERPSTSASSKLKRRRPIATPDGPQPSGLQESDEGAEEPNDKTGGNAEEGENQQEEKQVKIKKKRNSEKKLPTEDGAATAENRKRRKRKSLNLKCKPCSLSIRRASMGRHCKRIHGFPADAKWVRDEHPEVESEVEDEKTYVFDPADLDDDDFVDPSSPIEVLKRTVERQDMKIVLLEDQNTMLKHRYVGMENYIERQQKEMAKLREENKQLKQAEKIRLNAGESSSLELPPQGEQQDSEKKKEETEETEKIRLDPGENNSFKKEDIDVVGKMPKVANE